VTPSVEALGYTDASDATGNRGEMWISQAVVVSISAKQTKHAMTA